MGHRYYILILNCEAIDYLCIMNAIIFLLSLKCFLSWAKGISPLF